MEQVAADSEEQRMIEVPELALPRFNDTALALLAWENAAPDGAQSPRETDCTVWMSQELALNAERAVDNAHQRRHASEREPTHRRGLARERA